MKEELKQFDIDLEEIKYSDNLFDNIYEAIRKMQYYTLKDRFEIVLNNNLIECKENITNYRTILGCRISYDNLDKNISFIVKEDLKPSYDELEKKVNNFNAIMKELEEWLNSNETILLNKPTIRVILCKIKELKEKYGNGRF